MDFGKIKEIFNDIVEYFKNIEASTLYKFGSMIYAIIILFVKIFEALT